MEDFNHFLIRNLSKIVIVETNRFEHRVVFEAHYVVGLPPQFGKAVARRHRHRKHKPLRIAHASGAQSRTGRRAVATPSSITIAVRPATSARSRLPK